jgi:hypothetical protein
MKLAKEPYVVAPRFIDARMARMLYDMLLIRQWRGEGKRDNQVPGAHSHWGDSTLDALLVSLLPAVETASGQSLLPTYAYARLYQTGDHLPRHRDRAACEVAVTLHLGHSGNRPPPICFEPDIAVDQKPGDAVVYRGDQLDHWREPFSGDNFGQVFLNYVYAAGSRRHLVHDGRRDASLSGRL